MTKDQEIEMLKEKLARVEAERDTAIVQMQNIRTNRDRLNKQLGDTEFNLCIAQQRLTEAAGLLRKIDSEIWPEWDRHGSQAAALVNVQAFLADYDQAEQQEAQGAQAGDEARKAAFENHWYAQKATAFGSTEAQRHFDAGWQARAALATQPALRKHVAPVSIVTFEKAITEEALAAGFNEPDLRRHEVDGCEVYAHQHIQAAYSGWKLALEVSPAQQAIDLLVEALVAPNTPYLPGRIDSFLDSQPAVRGAEQ